MPPVPQVRQAGFTLLELMLVVVVIGIVAATGTRFLMDAVDRGRALGVEMLAWRFAQSVSVLHAWSTVSQTDSVTQGIDSRGVRWVAVDGVPVYLNERRWPASVDPQRSPAIGQQTADGCEQLLNALVEQPTTYSGESIDKKQGNQYEIFAIDGRICRYQLVHSKEEPWFFDYNIETGGISVSVPRLTMDHGLDLIP